MLEHWLIELVGHVFGLSEAQLRQIEKSLLATKGLVDLLNRARPITELAFHSVHVEPAAKIARAARQAGIRRLVHISGSAPIRARLRPIFAAAAKVKRPWRQHFRARSLYVQR